MFFTNSMLFGPLRILIFLALIYLLDQRVFRTGKNKQTNGVLRFTMFISIFIIIGFILTQFNFYDLLVVLLIIVILFLLKLWPLDFSKRLSDQFKENYKSGVLYVIKTIENIQLKLLNLSTFKLSFNLLKRDLNQFFAYLFVFSAAVSSQYYFFRFNSESLSDNWYKTLGAIKEISAQKWFFYENSMTGDLLLIDFYSKLTNISPAIALESFGLIEAVAMGIVIFWVVYKITAKNYFASFTAALTICFMFTILPLNLNEVTQHKSIFLSFIIALPVMLICLKPKILKVNNSVFFKWMMCFFAAIFFLSLYVALFVMPLFLIIASLIGIKKNKDYVKRFLSAYVLVLILLFLIYFTSSQIQGTDFFIFINSNIYSFSSYTLTPHLVLPFEDLVNYYQFLSLTVLVIVFFKYKRNPRSWFVSLGFMLFISILFNLYHFDNLKIDMDLLNQVSTIFIPIFFGILLYVIFDLLTLFSKNKPKRFFIQWAASVLFFVGLFFLLNGSSLLQTPQREYYVKEEVMKAYDKIDHTYMPGTYAVVNTISKHSIEKNKSNLINYDYFISNYLEQDLIFFKNIDDPDFLKKNPKYNLPSSTFVFIYSKDSQFINSESHEIAKQSNAQKTLEELIRRGRTINLIMKNRLVKVYEIVNKPEQSQIRDLLF